MNMIAQTETCAGSDVTLRDIETATTAYGIARADLGDTVRQLQRELGDVRARYIKQIRREVAKAADKQSELKALVERAPHLFVKPRTLVIQGVKVGYQKGRGGIEFDDADKVVELIHKHYGDGEEALSLLNIAEKPDKTALEELSVAELKKLGCTVRDTGDEVVIKPVDGEVDKIVNALLKDATEEAA
jgi:hypothetical protein